jgi:hypothetical protein
MSEADHAAERHLEYRGLLAQKAQFGERRSLSVLRPFARARNSGLSAANQRTTKYAPESTSSTMSVSITSTPWTSPVDITELMDLQQLALVRADPASFERGTYIEATAESLALWNIFSPRDTLLRFIENCFRFSERIEIGEVRIVEA